MSTRLPKIIAVCGLMRSGKDTVSNYLVDQYGYQNVKIADTLKKTLGVLFGFNHDQLEGNKKDALDPYWEITPREAMQFFGTEIMQYEIQKLLPNIGRKFWMSSLLGKLSTDPDQLYVISDMRFVHEYECLVNKFDRKNVFIIKISRPDVTCNPCKHSSESEYEFIKEDVMIINDDTITSLHKKIDNLINQIGQHDDQTSY